ncbi:MAG: ABC transporter permease [Clostridiales Family XIII bacterium]|jgi:NitT/TauT family transport system permease protein|nr:ABC transporter permease [Clostridiales Family XIII bacterium]
MQDKFKIKYRLLSLFESTVVIIVLLLVWIVVPIFYKNMYAPSLLTVLAELWKTLLSGELLLNTYTSLKVCFFGLLAGTVSGIVLGLLLGWYRKVELYLDPILQVMRNTSTLALLPLFVLMFGVGDLSKILLIMWGTFFPMLINTTQGVKNADPTLISSARSMSVGNMGLFFKVILPSASPYILSGFRLSAGASLIIVVGAEMLGAFHGLGRMVFFSSTNYFIDKMYAAIITLAILGVVVNALTTKLEDSLTKWQDKSVLS